MFVLIMPTIESICEDYGLDYNDTNEEELLGQQGLEAYHIEVNDGESFEIPQCFTGRIEQAHNPLYSFGTHKKSSQKYQDKRTKI